MNKQLTPKQKVFLNIISKFVKDNGVMPTQVEMDKLSSVRSTSHYLDELEKKGYIIRLPHTPRGVLIVGIHLSKVGIINKNIKMKFKKTLDVLSPVKKYPSDAGLDLHSPIDFIVEPMMSSPRVDLGVAFDVPDNHCGYVVERSSQGVKGVHAIGPVVDSGYTGTVHVTLVNNGSESYMVKKGDRICQIIFLRLFEDDKLDEVNELPEKSNRGELGHGSSGR